MDSEVLVDPALLPDEARPPLKGVTLLLPVWGYRFVTQFLDFCLPTLLAPGNIPAMAAILPTRFVVLSSKADEELIRSHPTWAALQKICSAEIAYIDDLITDGNHTTTITLAFARAVRETGEAMTDTGFVFLMSDYLFADGAIRTVASCFLDGASGILAGNFQIIAEEAAPALEGSIDPVSGAIILPSRDLIAWSLRYLHPATTANIVNFGLSHNAHTNRLLWRVDENTLIGRFYLIHPIGIRPEVTNFVVGASLDYSFIPEMCRSGNVVTLIDSDDYLVVEMQPRRHEQSNLLPGPIDEAGLAISLSEWTTVQHRGNAAQTIVYHAADTPADIADAVAEADAFIGRVAEQLSPAPQPFRNHPYWVGAIASNRLQTGRALSKEDWAFLLGERRPIGGLRAFAWWFRRRLFGGAPEVTRLHARWPDYYLPRQALRQLVSDNGRLLLVTDQPEQYAHWMTGVANEVYTLEWDRLLDILSGLSSGVLERYRPLLASFDACLVIATESRLEEAGGVIQGVGPLLKEDGRISVMVMNDRPYRSAAAFSEVFTHSAAELLSHSAWAMEVHYVPASRLRWLLCQYSDRLWRRARAAYRSSPSRLPLFGLVVVAFGIATSVVNCNVRSARVPPKSLWSSVYLMLRRSPRASLQNQIGAWPTHSSVRRRLQGLGAVADSDVPPRAAAPSEARLRGNQLTSIQAAHNVAARLLAGRHDVAVYGFDESDGPQIAMYSVLQLAIYDPGKNYALGRLSGARIPPNLVRFHDMLDRPLPRAHDSICCLRSLGNIGRADEGRFIGNLAQSLSRKQDVLILGSEATGSDELALSQAERPWTVLGDPTPSRAEEPGAMGTDGASAVPRDALPPRRFYSRTGPQLKGLAERFFECVLLFSIANGVLHPGALATADFALVICSSKKD